MSINFSNIEDHVIPLSDFRLKWRFTEEKYNVLPPIHLEQLKPLSAEAAGFLSSYISKVDLHADMPFKRNFFRTIDSIKINDDTEEIKKWLYQCGLPFAKNVFLSWSTTEAMIVPWKILIKYFDDFYYAIADDLTIFDESLQWALLFFHESELFFGTNKDFILHEKFEDI